MWYALTGVLTEPGPQAWRQKMEMLSGAEMVVRSLIDQGVKQVFGYPGGAVLEDRKSVV